MFDTSFLFYGEQNIFLLRVCVLALFGFVCLNFVSEI